MELQLFLIWHNAIEYYPYIIQKLSSSFIIRGVYETVWNRTKTLYKMIELYQFTFDQAKIKLSECGYGKVIIILVEDTAPIPKLYITKYGIIPVSKRAQEVKADIRNFLGNKNLIHGTMIDFELQNDILICLNYTEEEFLRKNKIEWDGEICDI